MSTNTGIEWAHATWNCMLGCSKCSPGCRGCYAILDVHRMAGNPNPTIREANSGLTVIENGHPNWTGEVRLIPERLEIPLKRRKPTRYFVNSLSDLFHTALFDDAIDPVFAVMALCPQHQFLVLTKRAERMPEYLNNPKLKGRLAKLCFDRIGPTISTNQDVQNWCDQNGVKREYRDHLRDVISSLGGFQFLRYDGWPLPNVWLGVSVESRAYLHRIDSLRKTPAAVRFLSLEPLLEDLGTLDLTGIHWVIVGGESGRDARPMNPRWVRDIRDQCIAANVAFFFKQWGNYLLLPKFEGSETYRFRNVGKKQAGRILDGRTWDEVPSVNLQQSPTHTAFQDTRDSLRTDGQERRAKGGVA